MYKPKHTTGGGFEECMVPPYRASESPIGEHMLHTDCYRLRTQQPNIKSNDASAIGSFRVGSASQVSRIVPTLPICVSPLGMFSTGSGCSGVSPSSWSEKNTPVRRLATTGVRSRYEYRANSHQ